MIKEIRASRNMTQCELAEKVGICRTTVAMWETGKALPRAELLPKLAQVLNCTVDELLKREEG